MASEDVESLQDLLGEGGGHAQRQAEKLGHVSCIREIFRVCKSPGKPVACVYGLLLMLCTLGYSSTVAYHFALFFWLSM